MTADIGPVRAQYVSALSDIREELRSYWLNHAFLQGWQWVSWNPNDLNLESMPEGDRLQPTFNRMRANLRTITANLTQRELTFENMPTAYDDATLRSARTGEAVISDIKRAHGWEAMREEHMVATMKGGTAAVSVDWDETNETTVESVISISDMVVEPGARSARTARWWIRKQAMPPEEVQAMFPDLYKNGPPAADSQTSLDPYMHRISGSSRTNGTELVPTTFVFTYYERPNPLCPEGKYRVEVGGIIVQEGDWPFPWKDHLNFSIARETVVENQWYGVTILDDVRPVQVAYNSVWSNILEHIRDTGVNKLLVTESASDLIRVIDDVPGTLLTYPDGTPKPEYMKPAQIPVWIRETMDRIEGTIDDLMGVHDVSRGMAPPNIESGLGVSILAEKDSSPVGKLIKESAQVWTDVASMVLQLHEQMVKKSREATIIEGSTPLRFKWKGSDLGGQTNIRVPLDAIQPRSRAALVAQADKAMEMGLITNIVQYAKMAELPGQEDIIAAASPAVAKARRENAAFVMDQVALPAMFDNHAHHIEIHNEFRMTQRYEQLTPEMRRIVDIHIQSHETMAAEQAARAQMQAGVSPTLAASPNADGSAVEVAPPPGQPEPPPQSAPAEQQPIDPSSMTDEIMAALDGLG